MRPDDVKELCDIAKRARDAVMEMDGIDMDLETMCLYEIADLAVTNLRNRLTELRSKLS